MSPRCLEEWTDFTIGGTEARRGIRRLIQRGRGKGFLPDTFRVSRRLRERPVNQASNGRPAPGYPDTYGGLLPVPSAELIRTVDWIYKGRHLAIGGVGRQLQGEALWR